MRQNLQDPHSFSDEYRVRVSDRAKSMRLRVLPDGTVELVLPQGASLDQGHRFAKNQHAWIERARLRFKKRIDTHKKICDEWPVQLRLHAVDETWSLQYFDGRTTRLVSVNEKNFVLKLRVKKGDLAGCRQLIRDWLKWRAKQFFPDQLKALSLETGFAYQRVSVRLQKTRWGSCSSKGSISLNAKLLFLPPEMVRYVLIHELTHTRHMNHSKKFWSVLASKMPSCRLQDKRLRQSAAWVPAWLGCE